MGYMALLRNLRNFDEAGVPDEVAAQVAARLADPDAGGAVAAVPVPVPGGVPGGDVAALGPRAGAGAARVAGQRAGAAGPHADPGRPVRARCTARRRPNSDLTRADVAKVFGAALALRTDPTLVWFDTSSGQVEVPKGGSLLQLVESFPRAGGGTSTGAAVQRWYEGHDRVVIVTDEQAHYTGHGNVAAAVPNRVPVYTWNLGGYRRGHAPSGLGTRHTFGGLTDRASGSIPLLERGQDAGWPF